MNGVKTREGENDAARATERQAIITSAAWLRRACYAPPRLQAWRPAAGG